jgi:hypothetical protein
MKLFELKSHRPRVHTPDTMDLYLDLSEYGMSDEVDVQVEYEYEGESHTDHPYGSGTAREHHPARLTVGEVKTIRDEPTYDQDGNENGTPLPKGTVISNLEWYKHADSLHDWIEEKVQSKLADMADENFEEPDRDDYYDAYSDYDGPN